MNEIINLITNDSNGNASFKNLDEFLNFIKNQPIPKSEENTVEGKPLTLRQEVKWEFFHPFFYIMMNKYKICKMGSGFTNAKNNEINLLVKNAKEDKNNLSIITPSKDKRNIISSLKIYKGIKPFSKVELMTIFYCYIDELCGSFLFHLDENFSLTASLEITKINDEKINQIRNINKVFKDNTGSENKVIESNKNNKKNFNFNFDNDNNDNDLKDELDFICIVELDQLLNSGKKISFTFSLFYLEKNKNLEKLNFIEILSGKAKFQKPKVALPMTVKF
jgi:hypothetical protein